MSLDYSQLSSIIAESKPILEGSQFIGFSARDPHTFILQCKKGKHAINLLLCLREPFMRMHLLSEVPQAIAMDFSQSVRKILDGYTMTKIEQLNEDRIVSMIFAKGEKKRILIVEFFPKRSNIYMLGDSGKIEFSLRQTSNEVYHLPSKPQRMHSTNQTLELTSVEIEKEYELREKTHQFEKQKEELLRNLKDRLRKIQKKLSQDLMKLNECKEWSQIYHEGVLLQANMYQYKKGMTSLIAEDWEKNGEKVTISLDPAMTIAKEVEKRFRKSKKMKAGISHLERQLEMGKALESDLLTTIAKVESVMELSALIEVSKLLAFSIKREKKGVTKKEKALPYHEFFSEAGLRIWVGKKAADNETLTFRLANGSDWWFHAHNYPGSHVVLKIRKGIDPDSESISDAMQLAFTYSKAKDQGEAEILCTQCKYVSRFGRGHTGKVQVSKHKLVYIKSDPKRLARLKASFQPRKGLRE